MTEFDDYTVDEDRPCEDCGSKEWETNDARGEKSCKACGLVRNDYEIDYGKDWRVFSDGEGTNNERTGMPQTNLLHDKGLTTDMGWQNKDYSGAAISGDAAKRMNRLRRQHARTRVRNSTERNLVLALGELDRLSGNMGLPTTIREEAAFIYRKAVEKSWCVDALLKAWWRRLFTRLVVWEATLARWMKSEVILRPDERKSAERAVRWSKN